MKKRTRLPVRLLAGAALAVVLGGCGESHYRVEGHIEGLEGKLYLMEGPDEQPIDSAVARQGRFLFRGALEWPQPVFLCDTTRSRPLATLFLEPGTVRLTGSAAAEAMPEGTPANDAYRAYRRTFLDRRRARMGEPVGEREYARLDSLCEAATERAKRCRDNIFGVWIADRYASRASGEELLATVAEFAPELQGHPMVERLRRLGERKRRIAPGEPFIDISQPDSTGRPVSLSALVGPGKYVLVDFWASWCGPCMAEIEHLLLDTYRRFHPLGLDIYAVSLDTSLQAWLDAVRRMGMEWTHVSELRRFDTRAVEEYAVTGIPSNVLIGPDGRIVAVDLHGRSLAARLEELIGTEQ